jgi:ABC-type transport system involved in multi-copper enzyme maturation permease subunit
MRAVVLIAVNYARMQWITLLVMTIYLLGIAGVFSLHQQSQEVLFFVRSQPLYVIFIGLMLAIPAIQTDRKSRRLLAVLSKGIHRWQYLGGLLCGCAMVSAAFSFLIWAIASSLFLRGGHSTDGLGLLALALFACCVTAASAGLLYSTFLHPLVATGAAAATLLLPYTPDGLKLDLLRPFFPVAWLLDIIVHYEFGETAGLWRIITAAVILAVIFWIAGAAVFSRRDVTISPE